MICVVTHYNPETRIGEAVEASQFNFAGKFHGSSIFTFCAKTDYPFRKLNNYSFIPRHGHVFGIPYQLELDHANPDPTIRRV